MTTAPDRPEILFRSTLTCPHCGHVEHDIEMPRDYCQYWRDCPACGDLVRSKPGDCCVFCSYGTVPCPPIQAGEKCCS